MDYSFVKDPDALLDYTGDWGPWLGADTLDSVTWTADTGLTLSWRTNTDTAATVWISGGDAKEDYDVLCHIVTAAGRIDDRTITIQIREK